MVQVRWLAGGAAVPEAFSKKITPLCLSWPPLYDSDADFLKQGFDDSRSRFEFYGPLGFQKFSKLLELKP
jgi:hypothetical protein